MRRNKEEIKNKSFNQKFHCEMVDALVSLFSETKTKQIFVENWWLGPDDWRVGLDDNSSIRQSSCMICIASKSFTLKLCRLDLEVWAHFSWRFLPSIPYWASSEVKWGTLEDMRYTPLELSIYLIKIQALYANYIDIFELKIVFRFILQLDITIWKVRRTLGYLQLLQSLLQ